VGGNLERILEAVKSQRFPVMGDEVIGNEGRPVCGGGELVEGDR
jgi:hypothetical protein